MIERAPILPARPAGLASVQFVFARILALIPAVALLAAIGVFSVNVPYGEEWDLVPVALDLRDGIVTGANGWPPSSHPTEGVSRRIMAAFAAYTAFNVTAWMYLGVLIQIVTFILLGSVLELTLRAWHRSLVAPLAIILSLLLFSPVAAGIWVTGLASLRWHASALAAAATVWVLARWPESWAALVMAMLFTVAGMVALPETIALWVVVLLAISTQGITQDARTKRYRFLAWLAGAMVVAYVYIRWLRPAPGSNPPSLLTEWLALPGFMFASLGWPLASGTTVSAARFLGLTGILVLAAVAVGAARGPLKYRTVLPWIWLASHAILFSLTGAATPDLAATATSYSTISVFLWAGLAVVGSAAMQLWSRKRPRFWMRPIVVVLLVLWGLNHARLALVGYEHLFETRTNRLLALGELYEPSEVDLLTLLHHDGHTVRRYAQALETHHLGPYSGPVATEVRRIRDVLPSSVSRSEGFLDLADCATISGWAWDQGRTLPPVTVEIYDGDVLLKSVTAFRFRQDLLDAGIGQGRHAFSFPTPPDLKDGLIHSIRARVAGSTSDLTGSPRPLTCN